MGKLRHYKPRAPRHPKRVEDRQVLLTKGWLSSISTRSFHGEVPVCRRCEKALKVVYRIHHTYNRSGYYNNFCWNSMLI